jgi:hypothetical protein
MDNDPDFKRALAPEHKEQLETGRADYVSQEKNEPYAVRAQRHFDIIEAGGDPHNEDHRHAFFLHRSGASSAEAV